MTTTPPGPSRLRTPPTPRHGPKYDTHEPYSPRRSTRINAKRDGNTSLSDMPSHSSTQLHLGTTSTPRSSRKVTFPPASSQTFSPPSSPISPDTRYTKSRKHPRPKPSSVNRQGRGGRSSTEPESDLDASRTLQPRKAKPSPVDMLPTPKKTPIKKTPHAASQVGTTARALFIARPLTIEDAMPSPRKSKGNKRHGEFSLGGLVDESESNGDKIEIYTDSKERIPDIDEADDNPFLVKRGSKPSRPSGLSHSVRKRARKTHDGMTEEIDKAVKNDEGIVYVFRGKKFYRKFDDANGHDAADDDADELGNEELLHQAGPAARRPFTRSAITPRLLFPPEEPSPDHLLDEEAMTDIEAKEQPVATDEEDEIVTPVKQQFKPVTPPTTGHTTRRKGQKVTPGSSPIGVERPEYSRSPLAHGTRSTLLDAWPRSKPGVRSGPTKREGEPMEKINIPSGKRSRVLDD